jgi:hypothetical protein
MPVALRRLHSFARTAFLKFFSFVNLQCPARKSTLHKYYKAFCAAMLLSIQAAKLFIAGDA